MVDIVQTVVIGIALALTIVWGVRLGDRMADLEAELKLALDTKTIDRETFPVYGSEHSDPGSNYPYATVLQTSKPLHQRYWGHRVSVVQTPQFDTDCGNPTWHSIGEDKIMCKHCAYIETEGDTVG